MSRRFKDYFNFSFIIRGNMLINKALIKYGYSNFTLQILEYCGPSIVISREQYYLDKFMPEYNILKVAGSNLGLKHTKETIDKISRALIGKKRSQDTLAKMSAVHKGEQNPMFNKKHSEKSLAKMSAATTALIGIPVIVKNIKTNEKFEYINLTEAAKAIGVSRTAFKKALDLQKV